MQATRSSKILHARGTVEALTALEASTIDVRSGLVIMVSIRGLIGAFTGMVTGTIALKRVSLVSCSVGVCAGTGVVDPLIDMLARTSVAVEPDIVPSAGADAKYVAITPILESMTLPASLE